MPSAKQLMQVVAIQTEIIKLGPDLGAVLAIATDRSLSLIAADGAVVELAEGDDMVYRAVSGIAGAHLGLRLKQAGSLSGACVRAGTILRCDDSETDPRVDRDACRLVGLRSMLLLPLKHDGKTIGVLKAMSRQTAGFNESDEKLLGLLSESIGAAMYFASQLGSDDLFHRATHDPLTGLANRSLFMERLRNVIARQSDTVARLGGDEFAIILQPVETIPNGIEAAIRRIEQQINLPFAFEGVELPLRASIGAAAFPHDSDDLTALLELADQRMYAIKHARQRRHH